jgi:hypothetical protein
MGRKDVKRKGEGQGSDSEEDEGRGRIKVNECRVTNGLRLEMEVRPSSFLSCWPSYQSLFEA